MSQECNISAQMSNYQNVPIVTFTVKPRLDIKVIKSIYEGSLDVLKTYSESCTVFRVLNLSDVSVAFIDKDDMLKLCLGKREGNFVDSRFQNVFTGPSPAAYLLGELLAFGTQQKLRVPIIEDADSSLTYIYKQIDNMQDNDTPSPMGTV